MSYPEDSYDGVDRRKDEPSGLLDWHWPQRQPQPDDMSPDIESLLIDLEQGLDKEGPAEEDDSRDEGAMLVLQGRLTELGVEDPRTFDIDRFREYGSLIFNAYSLDDVHYDVYSRIRANDPSTFVSIRVDDILAALPSDDGIPKITRLQKRQTLTSAKFLSSLGINRTEMKEVVALGSPTEKFELRCLARLMQERRLRGMARDLRIKRSNSWEDCTVQYGNVVYDALQIVGQAKQAHAARRPSTNDGKLGHRLEKRELTRASSFANPLIGLNRPE